MHSSDPPHLTTDSAASPQTSKSDNRPTISIENVINITHDSGANHRPTPPASPSPSQRSTSISIASIESDAVSSVIESDIDECDDTQTGCIVKKLGQQTDNPPDNNPLANLSPEIAVLLGQQIPRDVCPPPNGPQIASLSLTNSTDVTFGHKKYHRGPVTIQQILIEKPTHQNGHHNPAFDRSNDCPATTSPREPERGMPRSNSPGSEMMKSFLSHKAAIITALIVTFAFLIGIIVIINSNIAGQDAEEYHIKMISRDGWVAQPANVPLNNLDTPVSRVVITHTSTQNCTNMGMCVLRTRLIQTFDMESKSYDDIRYNFLVGGDGNVYIGRGWDKVGAHTQGYNEFSVGIALIGTFRRWAPPEEQLNATKWLLSEGVRLNKLESDYRLYGSRQLDLSDGPGEMLYEIIKTWPNWSEDV